MSEFSDYTENGLLDHLLNTAAYTQTGTYIALVTAPTVDSDVGSTITEPTTGSYARLACSFSAASAGSASMANATLTWTNTAATGWSVVGIAICNSSTDGQLLAYDNDMTDASVAQNDIFKLTDLTVSLA